MGIKVCTIPDCGKDASKGAGGLCGMHTQRLRRTGNIGPAERIRDPHATIQDRVYPRLKANPVTGCWEWQGSVARNGYGVVGAGKKLVYVHRYVFEHMVAEIPAGLVIDHLCMNRPCANPYHLDVVTRAVNNARGGRTQGERKVQAA